VIGQSAVPKKQGSKGKWGLGFWAKWWGLGRGKKRRKKNGEGRILVWSWWVFLERGKKTELFSG